MTSLWRMRINGGLKLELDPWGALDCISGSLTLSELVGVLGVFPNAMNKNLKLLSISNITSSSDFLPFLSPSSTILAGCGLAIECLLFAFIIFLVGYKESRLFLRTRDVESSAVGGTFLLALSAFLVFRISWSNSRLSWFCSR